MKRFFMICILTIISMLFNIDVFALDDTCTAAEIARLKQLANATKVAYEFVEENDPFYNEIVRYYTVTISNFQPDFYVYDETYGTMFEHNESSIVKASRFHGGISYKLPFFASAKSPCANKPIMTKVVRMLPYNEYSTDPLCVGHEKYELCKKFTSIQLPSHSDFTQRMKQYIKSLNNNESPEPTPEEKEVNSLFSEIIEFLTDYYMYILLFVIITGTSGIVIIQIRRRREIL